MYNIVWHILNLLTSSYQPKFSFSQISLIRLLCSTALLQLAQILSKFNWQLAHTNVYVKLCMYQILWLAIHCIHVIETSGSMIWWYRFRYTNVSVKQSTLWYFCCYYLYGLVCLNMNYLCLTKNKHFLSIWQVKKHQNYVVKPTDPVC